MPPLFGPAITAATVRPLILEISKQRLSRSLCLSLTNLFGLESLMERRLKERLLETRFLT